MEVGDVSFDAPQRWCWTAPGVANGTARLGPGARNCMTTGNGRCRCEGPARPSWARWQRAYLPAASAGGPGRPPFACHDRGTTALPQPRSRSVEAHEALLPAAGAMPRRRRTILPTNTAAGYMTASSVRACLARSCVKSTMSERPARCAADGKFLRVAGCFSASLDREHAGCQGGSSWWSPGA